MWSKEKKMKQSQILLVNDYLNHLRGKLVRFIMEEDDMLAIHNLMEVGFLTLLLVVQHS